MRIDCFHTEFLTQPNIYTPPMISRMSRDCYARAVVMLVKNGSSTSSCCTAGVAVGFCMIT